MTNKYCLKNQQNNIVVVTEESVQTLLFHLDIFLSCVGIGQFGRGNIFLEVGRGVCSYEEISPRNNKYRAHPSRRIRVCPEPYVLHRTQPSGRPQGILEGEVGIDKPPGRLLSLRE